MSDPRFFIPDPTHREILRMTDDPYRLAGTSNARQMLGESATALYDVLEALNLMKTRLLAGETLPAAEMQRALLAVGLTRGRLLDEVRSHERKIFLENGLLADAPLDFEAIRREIGGHLDRLRAAGDAGDVPEEPVE